MVLKKFNSVDEYIAAQPVPAQAILAHLRSTIRKAVPAAREVISYQMPTYLLGDDRLLHFAAWSRHYSIYASTQKMAAAFRDELAPYKIEKGTIRFPLFEPLPEDLIRRIVKFRVEEIAGRK